MPNRIVREGILSSERVCSLTWPEEVFYRRLMSIVDDYGRTEANVQLLRSRCYPLQTDTVRAADISRWMAACQKAGLLLGYEVNGKQYLELRDFGQQQRSASKYPPPKSSDSKCSQPPSDAHLDVSVSEGVSVVDLAPNGARPPRGEPEGAPTYEVPDCPHEAIVAAYHEILPSLPRVEVWNDTRRGYLRQRWREVCAEEKLSQADGEAWFRDYFALVGKSEFLTGRAKSNRERPFLADLEWLVKPTNFIKVIEGKYSQ